MSDSGNSVVPLPTEQGNKPNILRDRIAAAIAQVDDWRGVTDPTLLADAVIAVLRPELEAEYHRGYGEGIDFAYGRR